MVNFKLKPLPNGSSNMMGYDYSEIDRVLTLQFKYGDTYQYKGVPDNITNEFLTAESHGKYFIANIKNTFPFTKV